MKRLHAVKDALKKYSHVNKKAFEQFNNFTRQRDTLTNRRSELDSSQKSIQDLIDHLDMRKEEAIERTFKQVSKAFANIFERLVPSGQGRLVIQRKSDRQVQREENEESDEEARQSVENYTGVGISVSFNSKHDEQQRIQQLSGGQKSQYYQCLIFLSDVSNRFMRPRPRLCHPAMRPSALLPLRRDRRQPRRAVPHGRRAHA